MIIKTIKTETWRHLARRVGREFGLELSDDDAAYALWEFTGFPSFWGGARTPGECCEEQLRTHFAGLERK